jgi:hypothetical protein
MHKAMLLDHRHAAALAHGQKSGEEPKTLYLPFLRRLAEWVVLQIGDMGSSRLMIDTSTSFVGTPLYMAPGT